MSKPLLQIQLLTYNSLKWLPVVLPSLVAQDYEPKRVVVIDNASTDDTVVWVRKRYPQVEIIENPENYFFAKGHNVGFAYAQAYADVTRTDADPTQTSAGNGAKYILCANHDMVLAPDYASKIIAVMENPGRHSDPPPGGEEPLQGSLVEPRDDRKNRIGAASGLLLQMRGEPPNVEKTDFVDAAGMVISRTRRIRERGQHAPYSQFTIHNSQFEHVFGVSGTAPIYRLAALQDVAINGEIFDEDFQMYWEDADLAWRLRHRGWGSVVVPAAHAWHRRTAGSSAGGYKKLGAFIQHHKQLPQWILDRNWRNHLAVIVKNDLGWPFWRDLAFTLVRELAMLVYLMFFERATLGSLPKLWKLMRKVWKKRRWIREHRTTEFDPMSISIMTNVKAQTPNVPRLRSG